MDKKVANDKTILLTILVRPLPKAPRDQQNYLLKLNLVVNILLQ